MELQMAGLRFQCAGPFPGDMRDELCRFEPGDLDDRDRGIQRAPCRLGLVGRREVEEGWG